MASKRTTSTQYSSPMPAKERDEYEVRDALRTLTRADEIRKDKGMMRAVKAEAKAQIKTVSKVLTPSKKG